MFQKTVFQLNLVFIAESHRLLLKTRVKSAFSLRLPFLITYAHTYTSNWCDFISVSKFTVSLANSPSLLLIMPQSKAAVPWYSTKKGALTNFAQLTRKYLRQSLIFNQVADLQGLTLSKKRIRYWCFLKSFAKFFITPVS